MQDQQTKTIGIADIAKKLGTEPRTLRAFVRKLDADLKVGRGKRYAFASMNDPAVKRIVAAWKKEQSKEADKS